MSLLSCMGRSGGEAQQLLRLLDRLACCNALHADSLVMRDSTASYVVWFQPEVSSALHTAPGSPPPAAGVAAAANTVQPSPSPGTHR